VPEHLSSPSGLHFYFYEQCYFNITFLPNIDAFLDLPSPGIFETLSLCFYFTKWKNKATLWNADTPATYSSSAARLKDLPPPLPLPESLGKSVCLQKTVVQHLDCCSKVWGHPDNFVFSMKTHTFIYQMKCKMNRKYSQDFDNVRNNDFYFKYLFCSSNLSLKGRPVL